jgi:RNA polymerase sigma-70 factor (ECF subfamily)
MDARVDGVDPLLGRELLAHRRFVFALAKRLVRDAETAEDVTQDAMVALLGAKRPDAVRPWLRTVVRNVAHRLGRRERRAEQRGEETSSGEPVASPAADQIAQRLELQRRLTARVLALPPQAREVVLLHFYEGKTVAETAATLAIPLETARTRLRRALDELRANWNGELGGAREGLRALALLASWTPAKGLVAAASATAAATTAAAAVTTSAATASWAWTGAAAMTAKAKAAASALVLAAAATGAWLLQSGAELPYVPAERDGAPTLPLPAPPEVPAAERVRTATVDPLERPAEGTSSGAAAAIDATGTLVVHASYASDRSTATGPAIFVQRANGHFRFDASTAVTDDGGTARFSALSTGRVYVTTDRGEPYEPAQVVAGETTEIAIGIPAGLTYSGVVVDPTGTPVPDAWVEVVPLGRADQDAAVMGTTDEAGRFVVRDAPGASLIGARAAGFAASELQFFSARLGNPAEVRIELGARGGMVEGIVVGPEGEAVAGAWVSVGAGAATGIAARMGRAPPLPARVRSDESGRFRAVGIKAGRQPVMARAPGLAPYVGACEVAADVTTSVRVELEPGAVVRGVVRDAAGRDVEGAEVIVGGTTEFIESRAVTSMDGSFALRGLAAGPMEVRAAHETLGKGVSALLAVAGASTSCEIRLSLGLVLAGRVVDEQRAPIADAMLECLAESAGTWFAVAVTDGEGRFAIGNCPAETLLSVQVKLDTGEELLRRDVDPVAGELELVVRRAPPATARILGTVLCPEGRPVANALVMANRAGDSFGGPSESTSEDGRFAIGPVVPGTWRLNVRSAAWPTFVGAPFELAPDATRDTGTIKLVAGGRANFTIDGDRAGASFRILDASEQICSAIAPLEDAPSTRSEPLAPGEYHLQVRGEPIAAHTVPFTIRAGSETAVRVRLERGVRQAFELVLPQGITAKEGVRWRVMQADRLVLAALASGNDAAITTEAAWLARGDYELIASTADCAGQVAFKIAAEEGPIVRLELAR